MRVYRASALGGCVKAQVAGQLGFTPLSTEKHMEKFAIRGNAHEDEIAKLENLVRRQEEVNLYVMPGVVVQGHIDGYNAITSHVVEIKSMMPDAWDAFKKTGWDTPGLVQKYKWQISSYMLALSRPALVIVSVVDPDDPLRVWKTEKFLVSTPFYSNGDILRRVVEIERWVRRGELPDACSVDQFPCPFYYLHQQSSLEITEDDVIDEVAQMYKDAQVAVKTAETRKVEARKALDAALAGRERVVTKLSKVTYYEVNSKKVDIDKMREDGVDVGKYEVPIVGKRLRVTVKDENESRGDGEGERTD